MNSSKAFGPADSIEWLPPEQQLDRYEAHVKHCSSCSGTLAKSKVMDRFSIIFALLPLAFSKSVLAKCLGFFLFLAVKLVSRKIINSMLGPQRGERTSAAQFNA
jgi:hypothetical protein